MARDGQADVPEQVRDPVRGLRLREGGRQRGERGQVLDEAVRELCQRQGVGEALVGNRGDCRSKMPANLNFGTD